MFGHVQCTCTLPIDVDMFKQTAEDKLSKVMQEGEEMQISLIEWLVSHRKAMIEEAKTNIRRAQEKQKEIYDHKHAKSENFKVGNKVLRRISSANGKLDVK